MEIVEIAKQEIQLVDEQDQTPMHLLKRFQMIKKGQEEIMGVTMGSLRPWTPLRPRGPVVGIGSPFKPDEGFGRCDQPTPRGGLVELRDARGLHRRAATHW